MKLVYVLFKSNFWCHPVPLKIFNLILPGYQLMCKLDDGAKGLKSDDKDMGQCPCMLPLTNGTQQMRVTQINYVPYIKRGNET